MGTRTDKSEKNHYLCVWTDATIFKGMILYPLLFLLVSEVLWWLSLLAILGMVAAFIIIRRREKSKDAALKNVLYSLDGFEPTDWVKGKDLSNFYFFGVDDDRDKVFYYTEDAHWLFHYRNIVSASLRLGNYEKLSRDGLGMVGGTLLGGLAAGKAGAMAGWLAGASRRKFLGANSIVVHVDLRDMADPRDRSLDIVCYDARQRKGKASESLLDYYYRQAEFIEELLTRAIEKQRK